MSSSVFAVFLPDRRSPIHIEAESFAPLGCEVVLRNGDEVIARTSDRGFVVRADLVRQGGTEMIGDVSAPYVEQAAPATLSSFKTHPAPVWPFLVGAAFGVLCVVAGWAVRL